jgi:beta-lactam-binding protein with PASTA domain
VEVPDVMELGRQEAARQIQSVGLVPKFTGPAANSQVIKQVPAAGKLVTAGSTVTMTLRRGIPQ